jgi:hypothetical protein
MCQGFVLEHDSSRSSVTDRQMKTTSRAEESSQANGFENTIESSNLTDLLKKTTEVLRKTTNILKPAKK